jgi:ribonucleoside-diphosphate reductase alpha chain
MKEIMECDKASAQKPEPSPSCGAAAASDEGAAARQELAAASQQPQLADLLSALEDEYGGSGFSCAALCEKFRTISRPGASGGENLACITRSCAELASARTPCYEMAAGALLSFSTRLEIGEAERELGIAGYPSKVRRLAQLELYGQYLADGYSDEELAEAACFMRPERDRLFNYAGLSLLRSRYLLRLHDGRIAESPQEMFLGIALHLAIPERGDERMGWVRRFYDMLSTLKVTMATPTLANARKARHQLSSCFIDAVPDSLSGIYGAISEFAQVSKSGGGMGMYFGKVRARGSDIRGFKGAAGGVSRWIRLVNDTAVAVDQLGVRKGAVAAYLDIWHRDVPEFLQMRTNSGDDRLKAHDTFPALCVPDYFWEQVRDNMDGEWALMCPHEIEASQGWCLEDSWGEEWTRRYKKCVADPKIRKRWIGIKDLLRMILKSVVETGTPFIFNRDTVNAMNPNPHAGMIYSSNLCTEIAQNTGAAQELGTTVEEGPDGPAVASRIRPGDFAVCNLASLCLGRIDLHKEGELEDLAATAVRALDNVITLNEYPLPQAALTSKRYRGIGLGISGWHHMLAKEGVAWESEAHLKLADEVCSRISYSAISASCDLASERGSYPLFEGSDWQTGAYFEKRGLKGGKWEALARRVASTGMRNGYLMAAAPTGSTSIIAGTTAGTDPVMERFFLEEKKDGMLPRVAPGLNARTWWLYKSAHLIDQSWSVKSCAARQKHFDQAQSLNLYIDDRITMRGLLALYMEAWRLGVKTVYYVRSRSLEAGECESCSA